ncbi:hypothetical protein JCM10207_007043 [Rhodosporidiobolus poonsookiae]
MASRYLAPSPAASLYSSAASSPDPSFSSSYGGSPFPSPYAVETLSPDVYRQQQHPGGYFEQRPPPPPRVQSFSYSNAHFPQSAPPAPPQPLRHERSFHAQPAYQQPVPSHHYQQRRPPPLRGDSLVGARSPPLPSPAASSFSTVTYPVVSPISASFPSAPIAPYAQAAAASSTVSLGLSASPLAFSPSESAPASAPVAGEGDWAFASVVSPSLLVSCTPSPYSTAARAEIVYKDVQTGRPLYICREFRRGKDGRLLADGEIKGADGLVWPEWFDGLEASELGGGGGDGEKGALEYLLLECPSANAARRAHLAGERAVPQKLGLVTEETLYLRGGKRVQWGRFFKKSWFGSSDREGTWKGVDGKKYRWQREERKGAYEGEAVLKLFDEKTKETMVVVREVEDKPAQLIFSALVLPSLQPVLLTLLHRSYASAAKRQRIDQREWEDEEGRAW